MTVSYIGLAAKKDTTTQFLSDTATRHGTNQVIIGGLNARHPNWDTTINESDEALMNLLNRTSGTCVVAAKEPSYFKTIKSSKGGHTNSYSNPDIALVNNHETSVFINARNCSGFSDHLPVTYSIKNVLVLKTGQTTSLEVALFLGGSN